MQSVSRQSSVVSARSLRRSVFKRDSNKGDFQKLKVIPALCFFFLHFSKSQFSVFRKKIEFLKTAIFRSRAAPPQKISIFKNDALHPARSANSAKSAKNQNIKKRKKNLKKFEKTLDIVKSM